jgi:hypothetical protein
MRRLAFADRTLLLRFLLARAECHHVALAAATPVVSSSGGFRLGVVAGSVDVLREARIVWVIVGDNVALAWLFKSRDQYSTMKRNYRWHSVGTKREWVGFAHRLCLWCSFAT